MTIHWVQQNTGIGSIFGYSTFAHKLVRALVAKGVEYSTNAEVSISMLPPYYFRLLRFKKNVLFSMFEFEKLPCQWHDLVDRADLVIVPCSHNQRIFSDVTDTKVEICPGGVDAELYPYRERSMSHPFTFLFVGDHNTRKGTWHIAKAWKLWNERYPELTSKTQLIMKMTSYEEPQEMRQVTCNSFLDFRVLPLAESEADERDMPSLPSLYQFAHCFLFPTMGEGWGLPLCEAMASGLPSIYTPFGGTEDTASEEYAYPVEYTLKSIHMLDQMGGALEPVNAPSPVVESIVDNMADIYFNYDQAIEKGRKASTVMHERFGWDKSADAFIDIISRNYPGVA